MIELLRARLAATGVSLTNYPTALERFFASIVKSGLKERIFFTERSSARKLPTDNTGVIEIFDPVNPDNNIAKNYEESDRQAIITAASEAFDGLCEARYATTQGEAVACWQDISVLVSGTQRPMSTRLRSHASEEETDRGVDVAEERKKRTDGHEGGDSW